ncbi:Hypothetical predicted protein [Paramuricea clavata]|uniref:DUF5641 domain-containing protein n=1 Tax=Paramuricea clavata TaxID=317549 RepID=A0A7D9M3P3_PARCT|nr:Hypothetical predicted protein [Paramuricea clavata]
MAKCRIAPINKLSTPQMELNAAVLSKRGRKVIEKEMRFDFERVLQIVDSETVLSMIHKTSTRFKVYEGVRIGEIQAATEGDLTCWAWMSGQHNTADWLTRGRTPQELNNDSHWWNEPPILYRPIEEWGLKFNPKKEPLPGEKKVHVVAAAASVEALLIDYERFSNINKAIWVVARLLNIAKKSFKGGRTLSISVKQLQEAENFIVKEVQKSFESELTKTDRKGRKGGRFACLNPVQDESGLWVVGQRLKNKNPGGWQPNDRDRRVLEEMDGVIRPNLGYSCKWNTANRNLRPGDVVIIADRNTLRGDYRLGIVQEVFPSQDGKVRRVNVMYKNFQIGEKVQKYKGHNEAVIVSRSAQRLSLLVPVDMDQDQETKSEAKESV